MKDRVALWLELRFWDLVMWLDDRLRDRPAFRATAFHTLYTLRNLPLERAAMVALAGMAGFLTGMLLGWVLLYHA